VLKKYFTRSLRSLVKYFSTLEEKLRISARPCNILYIFIKHVNIMQRPICASLTMSESTLLIVCFPTLVFHILLILFVSLLQYSQIDHLIYTLMLYIASLRCLTETLISFCLFIPLPFNLFDNLRSWKKPDSCVCKQYIIFSCSGRAIVRTLSFSFL